MALSTTIWLLSLSEWYLKSHEWFLLLPLGYVLRASSLIKYTRSLQQTQATTTGILSVSSMVSLVANDGYVLWASSTHARSLQQTQDTSHDDGPEAKQGVGALVVVAVMPEGEVEHGDGQADGPEANRRCQCIGSGGAGGERRWCLRARERGRSQRRHPSLTTATTGQHCNKRTMERIVSPPKRMHRTMAI